MSELQVPREQAFVLQGALHTPMLGVLSLPALPHCTPSRAVVIVNGGAQYRAGAHRLFVQLARHLANQGQAVLRFDLPGQGDSPGETVQFEDTAPHIGTAIDELHRHLPQLQHTALLGLCDGASASLLYLHARPDPRITHLLLLNPWVQDPAARARAQLKHYYRQRLLMPEFWKKLLSGHVRPGALKELGQQAARALRHSGGTGRAPSFQDRMASAWHHFPGSICLLLSEGDLTAQAFTAHVKQDRAWHRWAQHPRLSVHPLPHADHTFSPPTAQQAVLEHITYALNTRTHPPPEKQRSQPL